VTGSGQPLVGVVMGSTSDWPTMAAAAAILRELAVPFEARVVSAHRTPDLLFSYAEGARERGLRAIIAGAGGAPTCPACSPPRRRCRSSASRAVEGALGLDSLLSIVQMPRGVPVATFAIGEAGAANAALFAVAVLAGDGRRAARPARRVPPGADRRGAGRRAAEG
jgi:5-(carboxyamino)imidazole ribonucleotide mutase